jgi:hypothetical protein
MAAMRGASDVDGATASPSPRGTIRAAASPTITTLGPPGGRWSLAAHSTQPKNADKDSLEISLRMADWLALHTRRQTHDR